MIEYVKDDARIIAEAHMLAQIVTHQYDYCQFYWVPDGRVLCETVVHSIEDFIESPVVGWFMVISPKFVVKAIALIDEDIDGGKLFDFDMVEFNMIFIRKIHELLLAEFKKQNPSDEVDCKYDGIYDNMLNV